MPVPAKVPDWMNDPKTPVLEGEGCGIARIDGKRVFAIALKIGAAKLIVTVPEANAIQVVQMRMAEHN